MPSDVETRAQIATMLRRVRLEAIDATASQHMVTATGLPGETPQLPRVKDFGFSSSPPPGSVGVLGALGGRSDRAMVWGLDHPDHGPRDLGVGQTALYDAAGNLVSLVGTMIRIVAPKVVIVSPEILLGSEHAAARVETEAGPATKVWAE